MENGTPRQHDKPITLASQSVGAAAQAEAPMGHPTHTAL